MEEQTPFERFKRFVSAILTVTKDDIQKVETEAKELASPEACEPEEWTAVRLVLDNVQQPSPEVKGRAAQSHAYS